MNVQPTLAAVTELESDAMVAGIFSDGILDSRWRTWMPPWTGS